MLSLVGMGEGIGGMGEGFQDLWSHRGLIHNHSLSLICGPWPARRWQVSVLQKPPDLCGKAAERCSEELALAHSLAHEGLAKCFQLHGVLQSATVA